MSVSVFMYSNSDKFKINFIKLFQLNVVFCVRSITLTVWCMGVRVIFRVVVFNAFSTIYSENHIPAASHPYILSHDVSNTRIHLAMSGILTHNFGGYMH